MQELHWIVSHCPGLSEHFLEWSRVGAEANAARCARCERGLKTGPPSLLTSGKVGTIVLRNYANRDVSNFFSAVGLPLEIAGASPASEPAPVTDLSVLSAQHTSEVLGRCYLRRDLQLRAKVGRLTVARNTMLLDGEDRVPRGVYMPHFLITYVFKSVIEQRIADCLTPGGLGNVTAIDPGSTMTAVFVSRPDADDSQRIQVEGVELLTDLRFRIIDSLAEPTQLRAEADQSRAERNRDRGVRQHIANLANKCRTVKTQTAPVRKHLRKARASGAIGMAEWRTCVDWNGEERGDGREPKLKRGRRRTREEDKREREADVERRLQENHDRIANNIREREARLGPLRHTLKKRFGDQHLGLLWTADVEARYKAFCQRRKRDRLKHRSRRFYLRCYVEKRKRRKARRMERRLRGRVRREQNEIMPVLVPAGTSLVLCPRLNYHTFGWLPRVVKRYFGFLALAAFHTRLRRFCLRRGAVLLNVCEGKTTKRCVVCFKDNNHVGGAKVYTCPGCGFRRPRDLKVSNQGMRKQL